jgi:cytochrome c-type biogenesis protein CcmH
MTMSAQGVFWFVAGLLTAAAVGVLLVPLLRAETGARSLWRRSRMPLLIGAAMALASVSLYLWRSPPRIDSSATPALSSLPTSAISPTVATSIVAAEGKSGAAPMDVALGQLEQRLRTQGGSDADWALLAQTYDFMGRKDAASAARERHRVAPATSSTANAAAPATGTAAAPPPPAAVSARVQQLLARADNARQQRDFKGAAADYEQLISLGGMNADAWADYADVAGSLEGGKLSGHAERYIDAALSLDPANEKALWLKASVQHETKRYADAVVTWERLLSTVPADSSDAKIFTANLAEDRALAGPNAPKAMTPASAAPVAAVGATQAVVSGEVSVAAALRDRVAPGLTLFIIAKSVDSPGAPVAVLRVLTGQWPLTFRLDDSLAMLPGHNLSSAGRVTVEARVSHSGTAAAQAGDLQSAAVTVDPKADKPVRLVVDKVVG